MVSHLMCVAHKVTVLLLLILPSYAAQAVIDISPKVLEISKDRAEVYITNTGDKPEFVDITLFELSNPGVAPDEEQRIPLGLVREPYLYASPFKLSLGPRQEKTIHLKALKTPEKEKVYRLAVIPQQQARINGTQNNLMLVNLGYLGLVRQLPEKKVVSWQHHCETQGITLTSTGTVRVVFSELQQDSQTAEDFNVYPGTPRRVVAQRLSGKANNTPFSLQCGAGS
ncbi:hypothetical protein [Serratia aquatilis]|uniref:Fimbria/pilus periplasmic chaperone n=1 Tax=Serratia aquatilis TaxID=1737515 RepID=A0ABV6EC24_9GAMM